jgi:ankyrin repeat protein
VPQREEPGHGNHRLVKACWSGDLPLVRELLASGADADSMDASGIRPLSMAADKGRDDIVRALLEAGADPEHEDAHHSFPLDHASGKGHVAVVRTLLSAGAKPSVHALTQALTAGSTEILELLLKAGEPVKGEGTAVDRMDSGIRPLSIAADEGRDDFVRLLLEAGADPEHGNADHSRPLDHASGKGYVAVVKTLLSAGAKPSVHALNEAATAGSTEILDLLLKAGAPVNGEGARALEIAAHAGNTDAVRLLLASGADVDGKTEQGDTALKRALVRRDVRMVRMLLEHDPEITRIELAMAEASGTEELRKSLWASVKGTIRDTTESQDDYLMIGRLLGDGAQERGESALQSAVRRGSPGVLDLLLRHRVSLDARNENGVTPLMIAVDPDVPLPLKVRVEMAFMLLRKGASPTVIDNRGESALSRAERSNEATLITLLRNPLIARPAGR